MRKLILAGVILYLGAFAVLYALRLHVIYSFDTTEHNPAAFSLPQVKTIDFKSFDNTNLIVWAQPAIEDNPTIIYFHGNAGNLANRAARFQAILDRGYGLVAMAYRRSSGSEGDPNEALIRQDSIYLIENLSAILGTPPAGKVFYYGESLGTAVAIQLANTHPPAALMLEAPFTSLIDVAAGMYPYFPVRLALGPMWMSKDTLQNIEVPLFVIHGDADQEVPLAIGQSVFAASPAADKVMEIVKGGHHTDLWSVGGQPAIFEFIDARK
ncbi:alpha/beta hydrolase [Amylibacter ulvae]|uniref:Alpha/beta hydrolase n=1 Tax=Paramylibacter ulvae TaxID=1651968 RepID=A0ABQ3D3Z8_9RHOB|nr:alpha/beta hydrolase [Amylibacter ulvae]GHA54594.1 alpha/beta hydrolase [Amylibacter ulvae]